MEAEHADDSIVFHDRGLKSLVFAEQPAAGTNELERSLQRLLRRPWHPRLEVVAIGHDRRVELLGVGFLERPQVAPLVKQVGEHTYRRCAASHSALCARLA